LDVILDLVIRQGKKQNEEALILILNAVSGNLYLVKDPTSFPIIPSSLCC